MADKVKIELRPYDAFAIICFCRGLINDDNKSKPELSAIHEAVDTFEKQVYSQLTFDQLNDGLTECNINYAAGRHPKKE